MPDSLSLLGILSPFNTSGLSPENVANAPLSRPSGNTPNNGSIAPNIPSSISDLPLSVPYHDVHAEQQTDSPPVRDPEPAPVPPLTQPTTHPLPQAASSVLGGSSVRSETGDIAGQTTNPSVTFDTGKLHLPPRSEMSLSSSDSTPSLTHVQSSSMDETSSREPSPARERTDSDLRKTRKEISERIQREAEKHRRKLAEIKQEQARAVMNRRREVMLQTSRKELEWPGGNERRLEFSENTDVSGQVGQYQSSTMNTAGGRFVAQGWWWGTELADAS
ncbi:hypothetical protein DXG01_004668 [Tephrocybe rancida]|nr:hypothetical protein DXG01_004668 [Tephrocybe rancida]